MLSCEVISDLMVAYASGEASPETRRLVEEHLERCATCREAFGKEPLVEEALAELEREEEPPNGGRFITRTRRLLFAIGAGALFLFACVLAALQWAIVGGMALTSPPGLTGGSVLALGATTVAMLLLYALLLLWRSRRERGTRMGDILLSLAGAPPLTFIAFSAFQLLSMGAMLGGVVAMLVLVAALAITFVLLPRAPYMTIAAVLALLVVSGLLLGQMVISIVQLSDFSLQWPAALGHPATGVTPQEAMSVDMSSLGLEQVEHMEVTSVGNVNIGPQARAVRATYEGDGRLVLLTVAEFATSQQADQFFTAWKDTACRVEITGFEINLQGLFGQGHITRCYNPLNGRAYNSWQTGNWATIIEVPGDFPEAPRLAREVKDLVSASYLGAGQE